MGTKLASFGDLIVFCSESKLQICNNIGEKVQTLILQESSEDIEKIVNDSHIDSNHVSCIKFSHDGSLLGVGTNNKLLCIWNTDSWKLLGTKRLIKRPMALAFDPKLSQVLLADKTGDVYSFPLVNGAFKEENMISNDEKINGNSLEEETDKELVPLFGHLSMLLDMIITNDGQYIVTCDRDEKIRVSKFPNAYNIQTFCLGHTEFVTQVLHLPTKALNILSCSGDGSLKLWNPENGICEASFETSEAVTPELMNYFKQAVSKLKEENKKKIEEQEKIKDNIKVFTIPIVPAIQMMTVHAEEHATLVACTLDRIPGIFFYKIEECKISLIGSKELSKSILAMTWTNSGELVTVNASAENPISVIKLKGTEIIFLEDHALIEFGKNNKDLFQGPMNEFDFDSYYKQRFDNVADYLRKKEERIGGTKRSSGDEAPLSKISRIAINEEL